MKYYDAEALPPCEFSAHCVRLLDDLDAPGDERALRRRLLADARDIQDEYLIEKLRVHVPGCPVCSAKVAEARLQRSRQRVALRRYLVDVESRVPSTIEHILSMARQTSSEETESPSISQKRQSYMLPELFMPLIQPKGNDTANGNGHLDSATDQLAPTAHSTSRWLRNGFALATAAALIFAALGIFNHFVFHNGTTPLREEVENWPSVIIGVSFISSISLFYNVDTTSGASEQVTPTSMPARDIQYEDMQYETVSPDGKNVLFHFSVQGRTLYAISQLGEGGSIVAHTAYPDASNAIWMDNDHILVAYARSGVEEFDIHTGSAVKHFSSLVNAHLLFYHAPYMYFQDAQQSALYRSNLATDGHAQLIAGRSGLNFTHCVLNPVVVIIYCEGRSNRFSRAGNDLYQVSGNGLGVQALSRKGILLGFAPDHTLLFLQGMFNNYQVVKLGETLSQDRVVMNNAAPASATIGTGDAMLAPNGHGLVVQDSNTTASTRGVWYDDLTTQTSRELFSYLPGASGQLIGWDQLRVSGTTATPDASEPLALALAA
jgi:hypothetical protein